MRKTGKVLRYFRKALLVCAIVCAAAAAVAGGVLTCQGYRMYRTALEETSLEDKVEEIRAKPDYTPMEKFPQMYRDAVIAVEDHRFYRHPGFDVLATMRAFFNDIKAGAYVEGGSTISQQLAKNLYFTQEKKVTRKIAEVFMAFAIEREYDKDEILELYCNSIYFGSGYYSIRSACMGYFGKEPEEMNDYECTMLAGIPNAPSAYALDSHPDLAHQRQRQVLRRMVKFGYLTDEEAEAITEPGEESGA